MSYLPVDVANMALARIGARSIATLGDNSVEARACNRLFNVARDMMLGAADWSFATAVNPLTASGNTVLPFPWTAEYLRPVSNIKSRYLVPLVLTENNLGNDDRVPFAEGVTIAGGVLASVIWTTINPAALVYTFQVTDPNLWNPGFVSAFSIQLASEIALPITGNGQIAQALREAAGQAVQLLHPAGLNEGVSGTGTGGSAQVAARGG